jgi:integrase
MKHFGETPLIEMTQEKIDAAALELYPGVTAATRNAYVYTPVSAILHHALGDACPTIKRPAGAKGRIKTDFMWPEDAFAIIAAADEIDAEFGLYLRMLIYTGMRKSEGLALLPKDVRTAERVAWLRTSKNEDPRMMRLREDLLGPLEAHLKDHAGDRLFRFHDGGHFKHLLMRAKMAVVGLPCPRRRPKGWKPAKHRLSFVGFHTFRHSFATWFRMYAGGDIQGLVATGNWRDPKSAARYSHVVAQQEWERVESLPSAGKMRGRKSHG